MAEKITAEKDAGFAPKLSGKKVKIMIAKSPDKHAVNPVPLALNGYQITVMRGEKVDIPIEFVGVLNEAVEIHYEQVTNPDHSTQLVAREAPAYPFQILGAA